MMSLKGHFRKRALLVISLVLSTSPAGAQGLALPNLNKPRQCSRVEVSADTMECDRTECLLTGTVRLSCQNLHLFADRATLFLGEDFAFAGALAEGEVALIDGNTLVQCERLTVGPDRVQGRIDAAAVYLKKQDALRSPDGPNLAVMHGNFTQNSDRTFEIEAGDFTLCDCRDSPPSWRLDSPSISINPGERATLWWPTFRINALGLGLLPVTPPLAPLSVPLKRRASGFLAPSIKFLGFPYPLVDLPFFIPLGESYDITLTPGIRMDWGTPKLDSPGTWGAPRLGTRVRYAPTKRWQGEVSFQGTFDPHTLAATHAATQTVETLNERMPDRLATSPTGQVKGGTGITWEEYASWSDPERIKALAAFDRHQRLTYRGQVNASQHVTFPNHLDWDTKIEWLSDDLIYTEFKVSLEERTATYLPSRTQLLWRTPKVSGLLATDYLLRLRHSAKEADPLELASNTAPHELNLPQRGPHINLVLHPTEVLTGLYLDAQGTFSRYGALFLDRDRLAEVGFATLSLRYLNALGPIQLAASLQSLGLISQTTLDDGVLTGLLGDLRITTRLARTFGDSLLHTIEPVAELRALTTGDPTNPPSTLDYDEHTEVSHFTQASLGLNQVLYTLNNQRPTERLFLSIRQPVDLKSGDLLATSLSLRWYLPYLGRLRLTSSLSPKRERFPVRELSGRLSLPIITGLSAWAEYGKLALNTERYTRSIFELASPPLPEDDQDVKWTHSVRGGFSARLARRFSLSYYGSVLLPRPNEETPKTRNPRPFFTQHQVSLGYRSPCNCWGVNAKAAIIDPMSRAKGYEFSATDDLTLFVTLTIADYSLGNR